MFWINRFPLVVLLALLQCFAPLLHAHAHDMPAVAGVHLHDLDGLHAMDAVVPDVPTFVADHGHGHGQVIATVREFRQDSMMALAGDSPPGAQAEFFVAKTTASRLLLPFLVSLPGCIPSYSRPYPQAPPFSLI
jgi:hypothetical protein